MSICAKLCAMAEHEDLTGTSFDIVNEAAATIAALEKRIAELERGASAGLIEAAKEIEKQACRESHFHRAEAFNEAARIIRARAADRSGK